MDQSKANVGYALLDVNGNVIGADEIFHGWLGGRTLAELLPEFTLDGKAGLIGRRTRFVPNGSEPALVEIESKRIDGAAGASFILRIEVAADTAAGFEYCDVVTGLPDRRALAAHRMKLLDDANGKLPHAVLFLDLDNFKQINDSLGHAIGDQVLAILADRWRKSLRGRDLIVRYGGDEFVVLLAGVRSHVDVQPIIERLRSATIAPIQIDSHSLEVSVAIGVALAEDAATSLEDLLDIADRAMYSAKRHSS